MSTGMGLVLADMKDGGRLYCGVGRGVGGEWQCGWEMMDAASCHVLPRGSEGRES